MEEENEPPIEKNAINQVEEPLACADLKKNPRIALFFKKETPQLDCAPEKPGDIVFSSSTHRKAKATEDTMAPKKQPYRYGGAKKPLTKMTHAELKQEKVKITEENFMSHDDDIEFITRQMLRNLSTTGIPKIVSLKTIPHDPSADLAVLAASERFSHAVLTYNSFFSNAVTIARQHEIDHMKTAKDLYTKAVTIVLPPVEVDIYCDGLSMQSLKDSERTSEVANPLTLSPNRTKSVTKSTNK